MNDHVTTTNMPLVLPKTLAALNTWIQHSFHTVMGPPRAYFELPLDRDYVRQVMRPPEQRVSVNRELMDVIPAPMRCQYLTLSIGGLGRRSDLENALVEWMWAVFDDAREQLTQQGIDSPLLFWRRILLLEEHPAQQAQMADGENGPYEAYPATPLRTTLTCRVYIPGVDLSAYATSYGDPQKLV